jgi:hypothetical protein
MYYYIRYLFHQGDIMNENCLWCHHHNPELVAYAIGGKSNLKESEVLEIEEHLQHCTKAQETVREFEGLPGYDETVERKR